MNKELKQIKSKFGEDMSHFCRENFPSILERKQELIKILLDCFHPNKEVLKDIQAEEKEQEFITYINSQIGVEKKPDLVETTKTPFELMEEAGYDLYHCKTEEEVQQFKKYYVPTESLCTFKSNRTVNYLVFFAVKKNISKIKRENFKNPERQDDYGTSVISIQFHNINHRTSLSIKNRYNHTVKNPDATFSNNLENIIEGLTDSFNKAYDLNITDFKPITFELNNYTTESDYYLRKYRMHKFNQEIDGVYCCKDNIIIYNGKAIKLPKEQYVLMGTYIADLQSKELYCFKKLAQNDIMYHVCRALKNSATNNQEKDKIIMLREAIMQPSGKWVKINFNKNGEAVSIDNAENIDNSKVKYKKDISNKIIEKKIEIKNRGAKELSTIVLDKNNNIISINNIEPETIRAEIILPLSHSAKDSFALSFEKIEKIKITKNGNKKEIKFQNFEKKDIVIIIDETSNMIEYYNPAIKELKARFLQDNKTIRVFETSNVNVIRENVLEQNEVINKIDISKAESIGHHFMNKNNALTSINITGIKNLGPYCFENINPSAEIHISDNVNIGYGNFKRTVGKIYCLKQI